LQQLYLQQILQQYQKLNAILNTLSVNIESNVERLCISCNEELGYKNVNYITEKYPKIKYFHCHLSTESFLKRFYYNETLNQYRPCYKHVKLVLKKEILFNIIVLHV